MKVVLLAIFAVSVQLTAAQNQQCPPGVPIINCFVNPCTAASCPNIPTATCRADYCGGCNARWYVGGGSIEVTRNCTNPCAAVSCLAPNCSNPYTPEGECCPRCPTNSTAQGSCPIPEPGSSGACVLACTDNSSCPGSQLCCSNGCGRVCLDPVSTNITVTCAGPNGRTYRPGETYTAADGCNTCTCTASGHSLCTLIACPPSCVDENGNRYSVGQSFPAADGCNNCTCTSNGAIACTRRACVDICSLPAVTGLCDALFYRYHYNTSTRICERFVYGGCRGNQNNFEMAGDCYRRCNPSSQCIQPTYPTDFQAVCFVVQRRWAFNPNSSRCESISYSLCGQDSEGYNVFDTEAECNRTCVRAQVTTNVTCTGPNGRHYRPGETYTAADGCNTCTCTASGHSLCTLIACLPSCVDENGNRYSVGQSFPATDGCNNCTCTSSGVIACTERACVDICNLPPMSGLCLAYFPSYFYNHTSRRCERFIYGGCGGNQNRFTTTQECYQRCNPRPPPPDRVLGFCSVVVWHSPEVSCEDIRGHEVRLYNPQSAYPNMTSRVGANENSYVVKEDNLLKSGETYVQVRVIHSIGTGEWSEGISLGCEKPMSPTEKPPRVYFELNGKAYLNNSAIAISEIGEGTSALYCRTDKEECCGVVPNRFGQFYYPNGVQVPIANRQQGFYRNRGDQIIRLNRREGITSPTGTYQCEIPDADDEMVKIYITLTGN